MAIDDELRVAVRLLKTGLRELNRQNGPSDFAHLPILLLASGFERMMKVILCCHHLEVNGSFPTSRKFWEAGAQGHNLENLLEAIIQKCFFNNYVGRIPVAQDDVEFLSDAKTKSFVRILSDFGIAARYYNLNVVQGEANPGPSPDKEWHKLKLEVLQGNPAWVSLLLDVPSGNAVYKVVNEQLTIRCEMFARALARLFTIGKLGSVARRISSSTKHFLNLRDDQLGRDYADIVI